MRLFLQEIPGSEVLCWCQRHSIAELSIPWFLEVLMESHPEHHQPRGSLHKEMNGEVQLAGITKAQEMTWQQKDDLCYDQHKTAGCGTFSRLLWHSLKHDTKCLRCCKLTWPRLWTLPRGSQTNYVWGPTSEVTWLCDSSETDYLRTTSEVCNCCVNTEWKVKKKENLFT